MVLKVMQNTSRGSDDGMDLFSGNDKDAPLTDFQREMILAEKHAENVRKRQRENLLNSDPQAANKADISLEMEEGMIEPDPFDILTDDDATTDMMGTNDPGASTLFEDEAEQIPMVPTPVVNKARVSKQRALHILEHPHCSKYLVGTIMRILVTVDSSPDSVSSIHPKLLYSHAIFKVERLVKANKYPVYGCNFGNSCDHEIKEFLGYAAYHIMGRVMSGQQTTPLCRITLNDICSLPISEEEIKFGGEFIVRALTQAAANLRSFTFTDEDVQLMLERKLLKESVDPSTFQGSRSKLIVAIQRTSHEIELLAELVKNDPSKLEQLRALEARKGKLEEQLQNMKAPSRTPLFVKNCAVLRASAEPTSSSGVMRKTTQPTPMIMFNTPESQEVPGNENRKIERRSISEMSVGEQRKLIHAYTKHMKDCDPSYWTPFTQDVNMDIEERIPGFPRILRFSEYLKLH